MLRSSSRFAARDVALAFGHPDRREAVGMIHPGIQSGDHIDQFPEMVAEFGGHPNVSPGRLDGLEPIEIRHQGAEAQGEQLGEGRLGHKSLAAASLSGGGDPQVDGVSEYPRKNPHHEPGKPQPEAPPRPPWRSVLDCGRFFGLAHAVSDPAAMRHCNSESCRRSRATPFGPPSHGRAYPNRPGFS